MPRALRPHSGLAPRVRRAGAALVIGAALVLSGCGPVIATQAIADATIAVEGARGANAPELAVYEFVSAETYLQKAREEEGYADYQAAVDLASKARFLADEARRRALAGGRAPIQGADEPDSPVGDAPGSRL
ncbi:MAG: DUF4398 domain-containing protein [Myxococcales bacterium]|nr:DUF4398 domain-containing protein [Myxococcales bacterium]